MGHSNNWFQKQGAGAPLEVQVNNQRMWMMLEHINCTDCVAILSAWLPRTASLWHPTTLCGIMSPYPWILLPCSDGCCDVVAAPAVWRSKILFWRLQETLYSCSVDDEMIVAMDDYLYLIVIDWWCWIDVILMWFVMMSFCVTISPTRQWRYL
jgi:hypothetical protein